MDHPGKKIAPVNDFGRTKSNVRFRDPNHDAGSIRSCSRLGCSSRHNSNYYGNNEAEKLKSSRTNFRPNVKSAFGSSVRTAPPANLTKSKDKRIHPSVSEKATADNSHQKDTSNHVDSSAQSCGRSIHLDTSNISVRRVRPGSQRASSSSSSCQSIESQDANQSFRDQQGSQIDPERYGLVNSECSSITDVLASGCSSSSSSSNRRADAVRRKNPNTESPKHKPTGGSSSSREGSFSPTSNNPSITRRPSAQTVSRRGRNMPTTNGSSYSAPPARTPNSTHRRDARTRFMELGEDVFSLPEPILVSQEHHMQSPVSNPAFARSLLSFAEAAPTRPSYHSGSGRGARGARSRHGIHILDGSTQIELDPFRGRSGHHHINMDGIAEVLLALDRIEHDEELSYEQLVLLETNLLLGGLSIYDQHRDLRLDIDNMSYEELLALGERMGTVNTALSEEEMSSCLRKFIYKASLASLGGVDDSKCSICQEEYHTGDEVCKLSCEHLYHVGCISQWFQLKNWCPICKCAAQPPSNGATSHAGCQLLD